MNSNNSKRVLGVFALVMMNVIAVDSLRTLPLGASYGSALLFFYAMAALLFFIPSALVSAELATGWPNTGGIYVWVREAFGVRCGFLVIWLQWIYNIVWYPTILAFIASAFAYLINPHLAENPYFVLVSVLVLFWAATLANCFGMRLSSWVSIAGALLGTIIPMLFIIGLGVAWVWSGNPVQVSFTKTHLLPDFSQFQQFVFFTAILYGLLGLELSAVHAGEVKQPERSYPRALFYSAVIILTTLVLASLAIALVVPTEQLNIVTGLLQAFTVFFQAFHLQALMPLVAGLVILGGLGGVATWIIGPTKGILIALRDQSDWRRLGRANKRGAPVPILLAQALIVTVLSIVFVMLPTVAGSYWLLTVMAAQLSLMVYLLLFAAAIRLRYSRQRGGRGFRIPGGNWVMWLVAGVGVATCAIAILLGFLPPAQLEVGGLLRYDALILVGIIVLCAPPFFLVKRKNYEGVGNEQTAIR